MGGQAKKVGAFLDPITTLQVAGLQRVGQALTPKIPGIAIPSITAPTPMPLPDSPDNPATIDARRSSIAAQLARRGRLSTILSQPQSEPLGG